MPEVRIGAQRIETAEGENLLDRLLAEGLEVPWSCRAGHCQTCLIQARPDQVPTEASLSLSPDQRQAGWLLSCQCRIEQDMDLRLHNPSTDGISAEIITTERYPGEIIRLRIRPQVSVRFRPGQHLVLWTSERIGRPYSLASLPSDGHLEFHIALQEHGACSVEIAGLHAGDRVYLGAPSGHMQYDPEWKDRPLLLLAKGTGLAPLQAIAREALERGHSARIDLWHWSTAGESYLAEVLDSLSSQHQSFSVHTRSSSMIEADMRQLRLASRSTMALVCGSPAFIEQLRKPLFLAGLPRRQVIDEVFLHSASNNN